jgi:predicted branched-subunit amino acid permease
MSSAMHELRDGLRDIAPAMIAAIPIGLLFGALCVGKGLSPAEVALMGGLVFAGGAQFAALEVWRTPAPIAVLAFSTLLINARHILMGASLAPKMARFSPLRRTLGAPGDRPGGLLEPARGLARHPRPDEFAHFGVVGV